MSGAPIETQSAIVDAGSITDHATNRPRLLLIPEVHTTSAHIRDGHIKGVAQKFLNLGFDVQVVAQNASDLNDAALNAAIEEHSPKAVLVYCEGRANGKADAAMHKNAIPFLLENKHSTIPFATIEDHGTCNLDGYPMYSQQEGKLAQHIADYLKARIAGASNDNARIAIMPLLSGAAVALT